MKKTLLIIILAFLAVGTGCGVDTPQFSGEHLFIVKKIEGYGDSLCKYESRTWSLDYFFAPNKPTIIAKKGLFQIGDTVKVFK